MSARVKPWPKTRERLTADDYLLDDPLVFKPCRSCGKPLVWAVTPKGSRMPLHVTTIDGDEAFDVHFATCPGASEFRRR